MLHIITIIIIIIVVVLVVVVTYQYTRFLSVCDTHVVIARSKTTTYYIVGSFTFQARHVKTISFPRSRRYILLLPAAEGGDDHTPSRTWPTGGRGGGGALQVNLSTVSSAYTSTGHVLTV